MKKSKLSIGRIILILLGLFTVWLSARGLMDVPEYRDILGSAVYLDEAVVLPENEGRMVIIHGTPEMIAPACDDEIGITLDSIKAYRYDEEYKLTSTEKQKNVYTWVSRGQKSIVGEASLGEFNLDEKTLIAFPADSDYADFDPAEISANGYNVDRGKTKEGAITDRSYVIVGGPEGEAYYYSTHEYTDVDASRVTRITNNSIASQRSGTKAYAYKVYSGAVSEEVTVAGVQQGDTLATHEKLGGMVMNGVMSQDQMVRSASGYLMGGSIAFLMIGLLLVFFGLGKKSAGKRNASRGKKR